MDKQNSLNHEKGLELPNLDSEQTEGGSPETLPTPNKDEVKDIEFVQGERNQEVMKAAGKAASTVQTQPQDDNAINSQTAQVQPATPPDDHKNTGVSSGNPQIADDVDLIEKEWVDKAKQLVDQTKTDPRQQNIELSKMKADYIKKRFNKQLKVKNEG